MRQATVLILLSACVWQLADNTHGLRAAYIVATILGTIAGSARDPIFWIMCVLMLVTARTSFWMTLALSVAAASINLLGSWSWQNELHIAADRRLYGGLVQVLSYFFVGSMLSFVVFFIRAGSAKSDVVPEVLKVDLKRQMAECSDALADKWVIFRRELKFKEGVPLDQLIAMFGFPASEYAKTRYPALLADPALFMSIVLLGVRKSGIEATADLDAAAAEFAKRAPAA